MKAIIADDIFRKACGVKQIFSPKILQESTTILQVKVYIYIVYVVRKLVGHPPQWECPINLASFLFPFICNARSLDHQFFLFFPMKVRFLGFWKCQCFFCIFCKNNMLAKIWFLSYGQTNKNARFFKPQYLKKILRYEVELLDMIRSPRKH